MSRVARALVAHAPVFPAAVVLLLRVACVLSPRLPDGGLRLRAPALREQPAHVLPAQRDGAQRCQTIAAELSHRVRLNSRCRPSSRTKSQSRRRQWTVLVDSSALPLTPSSDLDPARPWVLLVSRQRVSSSSPPATLAGTWPLSRCGY